MPNDEEYEEDEDFEIEGREIGRKAQTSEYDGAFVGEKEPLQEPEFKEQLVGADEEKMERLQEELTSQQEKLAKKTEKKERKKKIGETKREIRKIKYEPLYKASEVAKKGAEAVGKGAIKLAKKYRGTPEQRAERREKTKRVIKKVTVRGKEIAGKLATDVREGKFAMQPEGGKSLLFAEQGSPETKKSEVFSQSLTGADQKMELVGGRAPGIFAEPTKPQRKKRQIKTIKQQSPQLLAHESGSILGFGNDSGMDLFGSGKKGDKTTGLGGGIMSGSVDLFETKKTGKKGKKKEEVRLI